jgi:hypothetical protein
MRSWSVHSSSAQGRLQVALINVSSKDCIGSQLLRALAGYSHAVAIPTAPRVPCQAWQILQSGGPISNGVMATSLAWPTVAVSVCDSAQIARAVPLLPLDALEQRGRLEGTEKTWVPNSILAALSGVETDWKLSDVHTRQHSITLVATEKIPGKRIGSRISKALTSRSQE